MTSSVHSLNKYGDKTPPCLTLTPHLIMKLFSKNWFPQYITMYYHTDEVRWQSFG